MFFASFIAGSFLNQIQQFASAPGTIVNVLGTAAPQSATFFMSYILLLGLTTKPLLFLRLPGAAAVRSFARCLHRILCRGGTHTLALNVLRGQKSKNLR